MKNMKTNKTEKEVSKLYNKLAKREAELNRELEEIRMLMNQLKPSREIINPPAEKKKKGPKKGFKKDTIPQEVKEEIEKLYLKGYNWKEIREEVGTEYTYGAIAYTAQMIRTEYTLAEIHNITVEKVREIKDLTKTRPSKNFNEEFLQRLEKKLGISKEVIWNIHKNRRNRAL